MPSVNVAGLLRRVFGSRNDRLLKRMAKTVAQINAHEPQCAELSDEQIAAKTGEFRDRYAAGETLDELLPEAFAVVREVGKRALDMRHFDVQLIGGMVLHSGKIAEMRTGEGKTLVATLAAYLNALTGLGVHIVTVNDYLARRDAQWMGQIYERLGMSTGVVVPGLNQAERQAAYAADITYGTNNELGFDYLRDNMAFQSRDRVQRGLHFAIVDEVDSILIDEARTPLIISGATDDHSDLYIHVNRLIPGLDLQQEEEGPGDYSLDEKQRQVYLTEQGHARIEELMVQEGLIAEGESLYGAGHIGLMHHVHSALRAHTLYKRDVDYIVRNGEVVIVDEFTGRTMPGRRWSEGLHQAVEAKEGVAIQQENQTLASITFQNYFRIYRKLSGMTGTADTEAYEFQQIYGLEVVVIPTHMPMIREDFGDVVYLTQPEKFQALLDDIKDCHTRGQPVLVGTASIETSEYVSGLLEKDGLVHQVLNAKFHEKEAHIIAQAGRPAAITIATNMAGRGTDIVLGGGLGEELKALESADELTVARLKADWQRRHEQVVNAGGLHIIGTERHESRRIDNQLRGRSGRQGDPGSSRFYLSLRDNLMRIFASERVSSLMQKLGLEEGEAIEHPWVTKAIENAQRKVEARNFDIRKQLLEYDDVANDQRKEVYELRNEIMDSSDVSDNIQAIRRDVVSAIIDTHLPPGSIDELWDIAGLEESIERDLAQRLPIAEWLKQDEGIDEDALRPKILAEIETTYTAKENVAGAEVMRHFEKAILLQTLDAHWKEHLAAMDHLRQGIHLRGYAQKNPKQEYKREAFEMFHQMLDGIKREVIGVLSRVQVRAESDVEAVERKRRQTAPVEYSHDAAQSPLETSSAAGEAESQEPPQAGPIPYVRGDKIGRNSPCPCGSGKKYKLCHGRLA
ncbi:MAG: preprotein translocase subunit SecA [Gammaproteobacteria bacterium]